MTAVFAGLWRATWISMSLGEICFPPDVALKILLVDRSGFGATQVLSLSWVPGYTTQCLGWWWGKSFDPPSASKARRCACGSSGRLGPMDRGGDVTKVFCDEGSDRTAASA